MSDWQIRVGEDETTAVFEPPTREPMRAVFVCAHGAGGHMGDKALLAIRDTLQAIGVGIVRFNFLYRAKRSSRPDPMPRLLDCFTAVIARVRHELEPQVLIIGGRSMGGRAASVLASEGRPCDGLLLLAYPLHPPGQPEKLRTAHLPAITVPVLCLNGTRDPFCDPALMNRTLTTLGDHWRMQWIEAADHSFHVLKRSGRTDADVQDEVARATTEWMDGWLVDGGS